MEGNCFIVIAAEDARMIAGGLTVSDSEYAWRIGYVVGFIVGAFKKIKSMVKR